MTHASEMTDTTSNDSSNHADGGRPTTHRPGEAARLDEAAHIGGRAPNQSDEAPQGQGGAPHRDSRAPRSDGGAPLNGKAPHRQVEAPRSQGQASRRHSEALHSHSQAPRSQGQAPLVSDVGLPAWLGPVVDAARNIQPLQLSRFLPPADGAGRQSAVLVLFGEGEQGPELLLMERASSLRSHAGQPSFPGGSLDPEDGDPRTEGPLRAALREAEEETGLDPKGVQLFGVLPRLFIPVSDFVVTPVLGWWHTPTPVGAVDPNETARVFTAPVSDLTDPANRATAVHPSGHHGPAFLVESALVWGFTAGVIDRILHFAGWERPWDRTRQVPLDWRA